MMLQLLRAAGVGVVLMTASPAASQTTSDARLIVTVVDPSGAVVPGASVTIVAVEGATQSVPLAKLTTSDKGVATAERLAPGHYRVQAEFAGFESGALKDVRVRPGDNKHVIVLAVKSLQESVTVAQDAQAAAADPRGNAFKTALTRQEIDALSDDPNEMAQQLQDMAGGNAVIRVDSFAGARLPPKALIKSIHIVRDPFAAENHSAESEEIDIITQPGVGPLRGNFNSRLRDGSMSSRSPFTPTKGPERIQSYEGTIGGSLVKNRSSFSLSVEGRDAFDTPVVNIALPGGGTRSEVLNLRRPNDDWSFYGLLDYAVTRDQTLRVSYDYSTSSRKNLGIGGYDLPERAYASHSQDGELHVQLVGPLGRRTFGNTRLQIQEVNTRSVAAVEAMTVRVNDAFTSGGAQVSGGRHPRTIELASDIDYIRGMHTVRFGTLMQGGRYKSDDSSNYLGTYTFTSNDAFNLRQPSTFLRRIGDPLVRYSNLQAAVYAQDDIRIRKNLTLSPGLRYETQTHLHDLGNLGPRIGLTWAPSKNGRTTLRGSLGIFYNWLGASTYEQTLRVNGVRQREVNIVNPPFPDPGTAGNVSVTNKYLLGDDVQMGRTLRLSAGIDHTLTPKVRLSAAYSNVRASDVLHGRNLNAPVGGARPDPAFANEVEVVSDAGSRTQQLSTTVNLNFAAGVRNVNQRRWNWRRTTARFSYWLAEANNNSDGPFSVSPTGTLSTEWGPAPGDRRHRMSVSISTQALKNLSANVALAANTGTPYTITTGFDDNGDSIFNDRPAGVGRNTIRTTRQETWSANLAYAINLGTPPVRAAAAGQSGERGGDRSSGQPQGRYRLEFTLSATNLTNRANFVGFSGVMTSRFFQRPTAVANPRKIDIGMRLRF